jgi:enamine deaminase RidA (YjgF/YER057c/UK114 family)
MRDPGSGLRDPKRGRRGSRFAPRFSQSVDPRSRRHRGLAGSPSRAASDPDSPDRDRRYNPAMPSIHVVRAGGFLYLSGITGTAPGRDIGAATASALDAARAALAAAGSSLDQAVSVLVFLEAAADFQPMNEAYRSYWAKEYPTRTTLITPLTTPGALVEITIVAAESRSERVVVHPEGWAVSPSPYSYAIRSGDTLFLSGLVARHGRDNSAVAGDVAVQTRVILDNAGELLAAAGLSFEHVVNARVYLTSVSAFGAMNDAYRPYFRSAPPTRATVQTALAGPQYQVEITFIASSSPRRVVSEGLPANLNLPLSAAIVAGARTYLSGALGFDSTNIGNVAAQTRETLSKLQRTLAAAGRTAGDVAEAIVYVTDPKHLADVDREYRSFFGSHAPARTTIPCGLVAGDGLVEIMLTAVEPRDEHTPVHEHGRPGG